MGTFINKLIQVYPVMLYKNEVEIKNDYLQRSEF
jgi:hypothetical protein